MSIKLQYAEIAIECETPQEAATMVRLLVATPASPAAKNGRSAVETAPLPTVRQSDGDLIGSVVKKLGPRQKAALRLIVKAGGDATDIELRQGLHVDGSGLGGLMAAITKEAKRSGLEPERLFQSTVIFDRERNRSRRYHIPAAALDRVQEELT